MRTSTAVGDGMLSELPQKAHSARGNETLAAHLARSRHSRTASASTSLMHGWAFDRNVVTTLHAKHGVPVGVP